MRASRRRRRVALAVAALLLLTESAHAYLDPGSGSYLLQLLLAGVLGLGVALKLYWRRLKALFTSRHKTEPRDHV